MEEKKQTNPIALKDISLKELVERAIISEYQLNAVIVANYILIRCIIHCIDNKLYDVNGEITDTDIDSVLARFFRYYPHSTDRLFKRVKIEIKNRVERVTYEPPINEINLLNGTLYTDGTFSDEKKICINRLNVNYNPNASTPVNFFKYLKDLFVPEDIPTIQEYLGYLLIPTTKAQKALFIIGLGGEGKGRLNILLTDIFKSNMKNGCFHKLEDNRFATSTLKDKLLMIDDDLQFNALKSTGTVKSLITAETPFDVEEKGVQLHQVKLYCRYLCLGNDFPKALYDKSNGFLRRLIVITTKNRSNNIIDPYIAEKMIAEKEAIFLWMFNGLQRLIANNFTFTISDRTKRNIELLTEELCNIQEFLKDKNYVEFGSDNSCASKELYSSYEEWCDLNALSPFKLKPFIHWLKDNAERLDIQYSSHIVYGKSTDVRGFKGLKVMHVSKYYITRTHTDDEEQNV